MIRQFRLKNGAGASFDLFNVDKCFVYKPTGLGFSNNLSAAYTDRGAYILTKREIAQPSVQGEFVFTGKNPYDQYQQLLQFVSDAGEELYLGYETKMDGWYYLKGVFKSVQKGERSVSGGVLRCKFAFNGVSMWRRENPIIVSIGQENPDLTYDKTYSYTYGDSDATGSHTRTVDGHAPAGIIIEIPGAVESPIIQLLNNETNEVIGKCDLSGTTIAAGTTLKLSTVPNEAGVWYVVDGAETSLLSAVDLTDNNFFGWPVGQNCTLSVTVSGLVVVSATLQIFEYFASV